MRKIILFLLVFSGLNVFSQAGNSPCDALQLYPYTSCGNTSGPQYAGHYQSENAAGNNVPMTGTSTINPACTTDNETTQAVRWISVTATTTSFTITNLTDYSGPGAATAEQRDYVVFSGPCNSLTQIACGASIPLNGTLNVTGLTAGQTYYIMVSQSAAAFTGNPTANAAATCITSTVPHVPSNDACSNALVLQNNVSYTSTNADSTADGPSVCQNPASGSVENNVWYQWCAPANWPVGQLAYLNVNNQVCNSTQGLQLSIYGPGTTCAQITAGTATSVVCQNPGATTDYNYTFTATANQCYLIVLDGFAGTACTYDILVSASLICETPPAAPTVTVTQPTCAVNTGTIVVTSPLGAGLEYSINNVVYQTGTTFSGLAPGTYNVTVRDASDCVSTATIVVINPPAGAPAVPTITTTAPTCLANGFSQISNYVGGTTYTFTPAGPTVDGTGMITGMTLGTSYTVTATVGSCTSASSTSFTNLAQLTVPTVPTVSVTAPTCSANGFATITNYLAGLTYVFTPVGPTVDGTGLISGMTIGTNYTVSASNGSCASSDSSSFTIAAMLTTPAVPTITTTAPTCLANGFSQISNYVGGTTYTFTPAGPTVDGTGMITGMTLGTSYTVTATVGSCTSASSTSFTNLAQLTVPTVPTVSVTAPTCSANGFATITNYLAGLTYVFTPVGPTVDGTGLISGMTIGTNYTVSASNGSCASSDSSSFTIAAMLNTPAIATASVTVQPTCPNPSGTIVVTAPLGGSLEYSIDNGVTYQTSPTFSGLAPDSSYTIIVRNTSSGCTSSASPNIIINSVPPSPIVSTVSGCNGARFEVTASVDSGVAAYEWYDSSSNLLGTTATVVVSQSGTYEVRATVDSCTTIEFITIQVLPCIIPKGVSPNNDGDNDVWDLSGLNVQKAQIFNRYGVEVYSRSNYTNEWDGRTNSGDELPTATYYYVLSLPNGEFKTGWVYINRQQ